MTSPFKKTYEELARTSRDFPSMKNSTRTLRTWIERNNALHDLARQVLHYGFSERELKKATRSAKDDAEFDRKYGQRESQI